MGGGKEKGARERGQGRGKNGSFSLPSLTTQLALNKFLSTPAKSFPSECVFCTMAISSGPLVSHALEDYGFIVDPLGSQKASDLPHLVDTAALLTQFPHYQILLPFLFPPKRAFLKKFLLMRSLPAGLFFFLEKLLLLLLSTLGLSNRVFYLTPFRKSKGY